MVSTLVIIFVVFQVDPVPELAAQVKEMANPSKLITPKKARNYCIMSTNWVADIAEMHTKYGVQEWVKNNPDKLEQLLHFRVAFLKEEYEETFKKQLA